jgi:hypothetical protein
MNHVPERWQRQLINTSVAALAMPAIAYLAVYYANFALRDMFPVGHRFSLAWSNAARIGLLAGLFSPLTTLMAIGVASLPGGRRAALWWICAAAIAGSLHAWGYVGLFTSWS